MKEQLLKLIAEDINPQLSEHRGGCELVSMDGATAYIKLTGSCTSCPGKIHTFERRVIPYMIENVPGLENVFITDHDLK